MNNLIAITTETLLTERGDTLTPLVVCELLVSELSYDAAESEGGSESIRQEKKIRALSFTSNPDALRAAAADLLTAADAADATSERWIHSFLSQLHQDEHAP